MKIAYFNLSAGASGDMIVSSLIHAGLSRQWLKNIISKLSLRGVNVVFKHIQRNHLPALSVSFSGGTSLSPVAMKQRIRKAGFSERIKKRSLDVLDLLIEAESHAHHVAVKNIHFHQLAEPDTLIDIVAASAGIEYFNIEKMYASPLNTGSAAPATAYILKKCRAKVYTDNVSFTHERVTPTGAAILGGFSVSYDSVPVMEVSATGFGAGEKVIPGGNNFLKILIGSTAEDAVAGQEDVTLIETNIDDMDPRVYPYVIDKLFSQGALDAWLTPIQMKKGRPAVTISVLCNQKHFEYMKSILLQETTTLGIRFSTLKRYCLPRWKKGISKYGVFNKQIKQNIELNEAVRIAQKKKVPLYELLKT